MIKDNRKAYTFEFTISEDQKANVKSALTALGEDHFELEESGTGSLVVRLSNEEIAVGLKLTFA